MRDLRDAENPFRGEYSELDYWCYAAAGAMEEGDLQAYNPLQAPEGYRMIQADVTDDGFVKPQLMMFRDLMQQNHGEAVAADGEQSCSLTMYAGGVIDPALYAQYEQEMCCIWAEYAPPVPDWLAAKPPAVALLMNNGDTVAYGELGTDLVIEETWRAIYEPTEPWRRYDANGELVAELPVGSRWIELYVPDFNERSLEIEKQGQVFDEYNGYIVVIDQQDWDIVEAEDYLGNPVELGAEGVWGIAPAYELVSGKHLPLIRAAQLGPA